MYVSTSEHKIRYYRKSYKSNTPSLDFKLVKTTENNAKMCCFIQSDHLNGSKT